MEMAFDARSQSGRPGMVKHTESWRCWAMKRASWCRCLFCGIFDKRSCVWMFFVHNLFWGHEKCYGFDVGAWLEKSFRNGQHIFVDWMLKSLGDQRDQQGTGYVAAEGSHKKGGCMAVLDFPNQTNSKCSWQVFFVNLPIQESIVCMNPADPCRMCCMFMDLVGSLDFPVSNRFDTFRWSHSCYLEQWWPKGPRMMDSWFIHLFVMFKGVHEKPW